MTQFVGLDVSQKLTSICIVDETGRRLWRGQGRSEPEPIERAVRGHTGGGGTGVGIETGPMTPWLVHKLRQRGLNVVCLDARHASAALKMQMNKTDQNDAEGLVLLCHKFILRVMRWQQGQRGRVRAMARAIATRTDVIELVTWRSGRIGGSAGSTTVGNTRFFDEKGMAWS